MISFESHQSAMDRRTLITGLIGVGTLIPVSFTTGGARSAPGSASRNVLGDIPEALHAGIHSGGGLRDLGAFIDRAARLAVAAGQSLYFPAGTYAMVTWAPPAGLTVRTDGRSTVLRQLDTRGRAQRFIEVLADGIRLWPGSSVTIDGGMTARGTNATSFNSGVRVHADRGVRISTFECGDIYGRNLGGDVLETGCLVGGYLGICTIGALHGDNVYRNILSITGGAQGSVAAVLQDGGCGLAVLDIEPDPTSASVGQWMIGTVVGHRVTIAGDQTAGIESIEIASVDLDNSRRDSVPRFDYAGVGRRTSPVMFETGIRYRNVGSLHIGRAAIRNFARAAIEDIGSEPGDTPSGTVRFGQLTIARCGSDTAYQVVTQKTRQLAVSRIVSIDKPRPGIGTFLVGSPMTRVEVGGGAIRGQVVYSAQGDFLAKGLLVEGTGETVFRDVRGRIGLTDVTIEDGGVVFERCIGPIDINASTVAGDVLSRLSTRPSLRDTRLNGPLMR
jgi:hypothetical protein